ncbi:MAG: COP23 domain-containing protein [Pseudanabaena sp.]
MKRRPRTNNKKITKVGFPPYIYYVVLIALIVIVCVIFIIIPIIQPPITTKVVVNSPTPTITPNNTKARKFFCGTDAQGIPTTYGINPQGEKRALITWSSDFGREAGYTPKRRCQEVSGNFQRYYEQDSINYVGVGEKNKLNIICVVSQLGGKCINDETQGQLWTLAEDIDPAKAISIVFKPSIISSTPVEPQATYSEYSEPMPGSAPPQATPNPGSAPTRAIPEVTENGSTNDAIVNVNGSQYFDVNKAVK